MATTIQIIKTVAMVSIAIAIDNRTNRNTSKKNSIECAGSGSLSHGEDLDLTSDGSAFGVIIGYILGLYGDNGKENGNYYNGL